VSQVVAAAFLSSECLGLAGPCAQHVETHANTRSAVRTCNIPAPRKIFARQLYALKNQLEQKCCALDRTEMERELSGCPCMLCELSAAYNITGTRMIDWSKAIGQNYFGFSSAGTSRTPGRIVTVELNFL